MSRLGTSLALTALVGCGTATFDIFETCELDAEVVPLIATAGEEVVVTGGPFIDFFSQDGGSERDTIVTVAGLPAEIVSVTASGSEGDDPAADCIECQTCRLDAGCPPCGRCDGRGLDSAEQRATCFGSPGEAIDEVAQRIPGACDRCVEQVVFVMPDAAPGEQTISIVNRFGASPAVPVTVAESTTTGTTTTTTGTTTTPP